MKKKVIAVHGVVGNGPVYNFDNPIIAYAYNQNVSLQCSAVSSFTDIKSSINNNTPCTMLLMNSLLNWHWMLAIGWRTYPSDGSLQYVRVVDGWYDTTNRYYKWNDSATFYSGRKHTLSFIT